MQGNNPISYRVICKGNNPRDFKVYPAAKPQGFYGISFGHVGKGKGMAWKPYKVCGISFSRLVAEFGEFVKHSFGEVTRPLDALHEAQLPTQPRYACNPVITNPHYKELNSPAVLQRFGNIKSIITLRKITLFFNHLRGLMCKIIG